MIVVRRFSAVHEKKGKKEERKQNNDSGRKTTPGNKMMRKETWMRGRTGYGGMDGRGVAWRGVADIGKSARSKARIGKAKVLYIASTDNQSEGRSKN